MSFRSYASDQPASSKDCCCEPGLEPPSTAVARASDHRDRLSGAFVCQSLRSGPYGGAFEVRHAVQRTLEVFMSAVRALAALGSTRETTHVCMHSVCTVASHESPGRGFDCGTLCIRSRGYSPWRDRLSSSAREGYGTAH